MLRERDYARSQQQESQVRALVCETQCVLSVHVRPSLTPLMLLQDQGSGAGAAGRRVSRQRRT